MKVKIPFLTSSIETDLMLIILLAPFWWVTGLAVAAYYALTFWVFLKFVLDAIRNYRKILFPLAGNLLFFFLFSYMISIVINVPLRPSQRIFSSFNNWLMFFMSYLVIMLVYNCEPAIFFKKLARTCRFLTVFTGILGVAILLLWTQGHKIQIPTLLGKYFPSLTDFPYFYGQLSIQGTMPDWLTGEDILPRLTPYSLSPTATGGLMLMLFPAAFGYYSGKNKNKAGRWLVLFLGLTVLIFSLSRSAIYSFILSAILVFAAARGMSIMLSLSAAFGGLVASGLFSKLAEWVLNLRKSSSTGRLELFEEALKIVWEENIFMGLGVRLREGFTFMAIGTHGGMYLEVIFTTGLLGLLFFGLFQFFTIAQWFTGKAELRHPVKRKLWNSLGMSLLGVHIWLLTDSLVAYPLIAYAYGLIVGASLLLKRNIGFEKWDELA